MKCLLEIVVILLLLFLWQPVTAQDYEVVNITPAGFAYASVLDMNHQGQVLGVGRQGDQFFNFLWQDGQTQILGAADGLEGWHAINDNGDMVGSWLYSSECGNCGALSGPRQTIGYGTFSSGGHLASGPLCYADGPYCKNLYGTPWYLNNGNVVVGTGIFLEDDSPVFRAYMGNSSVQNLGVLSGDGESGAVAINDSGLVAGWSKNGTSDLYTAVTWTGTTITPLPRLFDGYPSRAWGLNAGSVVVGEAATPFSNSAWEAVFWDGGIQMLGIKGVAKAVNDGKDIVIEGESGSAYLWKNNVLYNILDLLPPDHGFPENGFYPRCINNSGMIIGTAGKGTDMQAIVLIPDGRSTISGIVLKDGNPLADVTILTDSGQNVKTDVNGYYEFELAAGTYTLFPEKERFRFTPEQQHVTVPPDVSGVNFNKMEDLPPDLVELDITLSPGEVGFTVLWEAPGADGGSGGPAAEYDLRYNNIPIDESNWDSCMQFEGEPVPTEPGAEQSMYVNSLAVNATWYLAMKTTDSKGNWSELSNSVLVSDTGFRPLYDGYSWDSSHAPVRYMTKNDLRNICGDQQVCWNAGPDCIPYGWVYAMLIFLNANNPKGLCTGASISSLRFFNGLDNIQDFNPQADTVYDFTLDDVMDPVLHYQTIQFFSPINDYIRENWVTQEVFVSQLLNHITAGNPVHIGIDAPDIFHAVVPVSVLALDNHTYIIIVYDPERPSQLTSLKIDNLAGTWGYYQIGPDQYKFNGTAQGNNFQLLPISVFFPPFSGFSECKISDKVRVAIYRPKIIEDATSKMYLTVTDYQGRQTGYVDGQLVNDIPWATVTKISSQWTSIEPVYDLPSDGEYVISINGAGVMESDTVGVTQFGPGYTAWIDNITVTDETLDLLQVVQEGRHLIFETTDSQQVVLGLAVDLPEKSCTFQVKDVQVNPKQTISIEIQEGSGRFLFHNTQNSNGTYSFSIERAHSQGHEIFSYENLSIAALATHEFDYENWDGTGSVTQFIDHNSDGFIDETSVLMNGGSPEDLDGDAVFNEIDNCPMIPNSDQFDTDGDQLGNICDPCPFDKDNDEDTDGSDLSGLAAIGLLPEELRDLASNFGTICP